MSQRKSNPHQSRQHEVLGTLCPPTRTFTPTPYAPRGSRTPINWLRASCSAIELWGHMVWGRAWSNCLRGSCSTKLSYGRTKGGTALPLSYRGIWCGANCPTAVGLRLRLECPPPHVPAGTQFCLPAGRQAITCFVHEQNWCAIIPLRSNLLYQKFLKNGRLITPRLRRSALAPPSKPCI